MFEKRTARQPSNISLVEMVDDNTLKLNATGYVYGTGAQAGHRTALGINNVDNTSDLDKPISTATQIALSGKSNTGHFHDWADLKSGTVHIVPFDTGNGGPENLGELAWLSDIGSLALQGIGGAILEYGEKVVYHTENQYGSSIPKGTPVAYVGTNGSSGKTLIAPWNGTIHQPIQFMGCTASNINNEDNGYVVHFGKIRGINTTAYPISGILYANPSGTGLVTEQPNVTHVVVAATINSSNNGTILVRPTIERVYGIGQITGLAAGVKEFLENPTSANLAAAVSDETGTESLVFANSPRFVGNPSIEGNRLQSTVIKDGPIPFPQIFEDFPMGNNGGPIGTHSWFVARSAGGSNGQYNADSGQTNHRAYGIQFIRTAASGNAVSSFILGNYNGPSTTCYGTSFQICFAAASASDCRVRTWFGGGGTDVELRLDFTSGVLRLLRPSVSLNLITGLSLSAGNFLSGSRYRMHLRPISNTQTECYLSEATGTSTNWATLYDEIVTHSSSIIGWNCSTPQLGIQTTTGIAKTMYVDWASITTNIQR